MSGFQMSPVFEWSDFGSLLQFFFQIPTGLESGLLRKIMHLENVPSPILIRLVAGDVVQVPQALDGLRPQQVVSVVCLDVEVGRRIGSSVEVADLGGQVGRLPSKGQVTCVG